MQRKNEAGISESCACYAMHLGGMLRGRGQQFTKILLPSLFALVLSTM